MGLGWVASAAGPRAGHRAFGGSLRRVVLFGLLGAVLMLVPVASSSAQEIQSDQTDASTDAVVDDRAESLGEVDPVTGLEDEATVEAEIESGEIKNPDPLEGMNRKIFWLNEKADIYAIAPVSRGWRFVVPGFARKGIENFNGLLIMPVVLGNGILQLKPKNAFQDVLRIVYNATFGIAGFVDAASMVDIPKNDEDFGQTLGFWGVPPGPYLVLPVFGPSNFRDGVGRLGDTAGTFYFSFLPFWSTFIVRSVELVNLRARFLEEVDENRRESFDYYVFLRDAYLQNRESRVGRSRGEDESGTPPEDDLYYFEDEFEDGDEDDFENGDEEPGASAVDEGAPDGSDVDDARDG